MRQRLRIAAEEGKASGQVRPEVDAEALATVILATLEGGVMLSKLYGDLRHLERAADHLVEHLTWRVRA